MKTTDESLHKTLITLSSSFNGGGTKFRDQVASQGLHSAKVSHGGSNLGFLQRLVCYHSNMQSNLIVNE